MSLCRGSFPDPRTLANHCSLSHLLVFIYVTACSPWSEIILFVEFCAYCHSFLRRNKAMTVLLSPPWPEWPLACAWHPKHLQNLCHTPSAAPSPCLSHGLAVGDLCLLQFKTLNCVWSWICQSPSFSSWPVRRKGSPRESGAFQIVEEAHMWLTQFGTINTSWEINL